MPEEQSFFYSSAKNEDTASCAKRRHVDMEMVLSLPFLPGASHGAKAHCRSRSKQTLNMLFPKVGEFCYLSLNLVVGTTKAMFLLTKNC